jgi:KTSC domain
MTVTSHSTASTAIANLTFVTEDETPNVSALLEVLEVEEPEAALIPIPASYGTLYITFTDGSRYTIEDFPAIELDRWLGSPSIGGYFNAFVRGNY